MFFRSVCRVWFVGLVWLAFGHGQALAGGGNGSGTAPSLADCRSAITWNRVMGTGLGLTAVGAAGLGAGATLNFPPLTAPGVLLTVGGIGTTTVGALGMASGHQRCGVGGTANLAAFSGTLVSLAIPVTTIGTALFVSNLIDSDGVYAVLNGAVMVGGAAVILGFMFPVLEHTQVLRERRLSVTLLPDLSPRAQGLRVVGTF